MFTQTIFYNILLAGILTLFVAAASIILSWLYIVLIYELYFFKFYRMARTTKGDVNGFFLKRNDKITFTCKSDKSLIEGQVIGFYTNSKGTKYLLVKQLKLSQVDMIRIDNIGDDIA